MCLDALVTSSQFKPLPLSSFSTLLIRHVLHINASLSSLGSLMPTRFLVISCSSVLLKAVCAVLRTPIANVDHLTVRLPDPDAPKVHWILDCYNGMRKTSWITCNVEPDIQHLSLDRQKFPSNFDVRPRDLNRLLANFQSSIPNFN